MKEYLQSIADDVKDIFNHDIETTKTFNVPGRNDAGLTFGKHQIKRGKLIETCVLFIDIRNSTIISKNLKKDKAKLGKIYSAFIQSMASIADKYGYVRNIIGDRVMVVFEPGDCFIEAVNCAAVMYTTAHGILKKYSALENFKVGIGIDFGEMLVLKTGIVKHHEEQSEYKNLVWVGDVANIASKLTDFANKEYNAPEFNITYEYLDTIQVPKPASQNPSFLEQYFGPGFESKVVKKTSTTTMPAQDYLAKIIWSTDGPKYDSKKVINIEKKEQAGTTSPILMSGNIFNGLKAIDPKFMHLQKLTKKQYPGQPFTGSGIYGGTLLYPEISQIKL